VTLFVIDIWMDGYDTEEEMEEVIPDFIYECLTGSATSVKIFNIDKKRLENFVAKEISK